MPRSTAGRRSLWPSLAVSLAVSLSSACTRPKPGEPVDAPIEELQIDAAADGGRDLRATMPDAPRDLEGVVDVDAPGDLATSPDVTPSADMVASGDGPGSMSGLPLGARCNSPAACAQGYCVEGVCCDGACAGKCQSCLQANTGTAVDGRCAPVKVGTVHGNDCPAQQCPAGSSTQTAAATCDGQGGCTPGATTSCASYQCDPGANRCRTRCGAAGDCAAGAYCSGNSCVAKKADGSPCAGAAECSSNVCGGRCCPAGTTCTCARPHVNNALANPGFDTDLTGWTVRPGEGTVAWTNMDYQSCPVSGSARLTVADHIGRSIEQCVPIKPSTTYYFHAKLRASGAGEEIICEVDLFDQAGCAGPATDLPDATERAILPTWGPGGGDPFTTHATAASALVFCWLDARGHPSRTGDVDFLYLGVTNEEF